MGVCNEDGTCTCADGYSGLACQNTGDVCYGTSNGVGGHHSPHLLGLGSALDEPGEDAEAQCRLIRHVLHDHWNQLVLAD